MGAFGRPLRSRLARMSGGGRVAELLAIVQLGSSAADGLMSGTFALYLVTVRDVAVDRAALLLSVAEVSGMAGSAAVGWASDRFGRRATLVSAFSGAFTSCLLLGALDLGYLGMTMAASCVAFSVRGASSARNAVVADQGDHNRVRLRAYLRTVMNAGLLGGLGLAALVAATRSDAVYRFAFVGAAICYVSCVAASGRLVSHVNPGDDLRPSGAGASNRPGTPVWRNTGYLMAMAALACFVVNFETFGLGLSLWLVGIHHAPPWLVPAALTVNSVLAIVLQVRLSGRVDSVRASVRAILKALIWVSAGSLILAAAPSLGGWVVALAVAAAAIHTVGDVLGSAGQWGLEMDLAEAGRQGEYQGVASLLAGAARSLAPQLVVFFLLGFDTQGWIGVIAFFGIAAAAVRWSALRMFNRRLGATA